MSLAIACFSARIKTTLCKKNIFDTHDELEQL